MSAAKAGVVVGVRNAAMSATAALGFVRALLLFRRFRFGLGFWLSFGLSFWLGFRFCRGLGLGFGLRFCVLFVGLVLIGPILRCVGSGRSEKQEQSGGTDNSE